MEMVKTKVINIWFELKKPVFTTYLFFSNVYV